MSDEQSGCDPFENGFSEEAVRKSYKNEITRLRAENKKLQDVLDDARKVISIQEGQIQKLREDIKSRFPLKSAQQIRDETDRLIEKHRESVNDWLEAGSWKQSGAGNE